MTDITKKVTIVCHKDINVDFAITNNKLHIDLDVLDISNADLVQIYPKEISYPKLNKAAKKNLRCENIVVKQTKFFNILLKMRNSSAKV